MSRRGRAANQEAIVPAEREIAEQFEEELVPLNLQALELLENGAEEDRVLYGGIKFSLRIDPRKWT